MSIYIRKQTLDGNSILTANLPLEALLGGPLGLASQSLIEMNFITSPAYMYMCAWPSRFKSSYTRRQRYVSLEWFSCFLLYLPLMNRKRIEIFDNWPCGPRLCHKTRPGHVKSYQRRG